MFPQLGEQEYHRSDQSLRGDVAIVQQNEGTGSQPTLDAAHNSSGISDTRVEAAHIPADDFQPQSLSDAKGVRVRQPDWRAKEAGSRAGVFFDGLLYAVQLCRQFGCWVKVG